MKLENEVEELSLRGKTCRDIITGYQGVVMGVTHYLTGCSHVGLLNPSLGDKGEIKDWQWFDIGRVELVKNKKQILLDNSNITITEKKKEKVTGGPSPHPNKRT